MNGLNKSISFGKKRSKIKYPTKKTLNLYIKEKDGNSLSRVIPALLFVAILVAVICKFGVIDRLETVSKAQSELDKNKAELALITEQLTDYDSVVEDYHRYTSNYLTPEELYQVDRIELLDMLEEKAGESIYISNIEIKDSTVKISISASTLSDIAAFKLRLQSSEYVISVSVYNADTKDTQSEGAKTVSASLVVDVSLPEEAEE